MNGQARAIDSELAALAWLDAFTRNDEQATDALLATTPDQTLVVGLTGLAFTFREMLATATGATKACATDWIRARLLADSAGAA